MKSYHLVLTQRCNLSCSYCGSECIPSLMPINLDYSLKKLQDFFSRDIELPNIAFYGGEPLLESTKIQDVIDQIDAKAFHIQTNGSLLHKLPSKYLRRLTTILLSVDGRPELTDYYRGQKTFTKAIKGAKYTRSHGFTGDLIARMTVSEMSDIYKEVKFLLAHNNPQFDHIHWQLDAMWDDDMSSRWTDFSKWLHSSYNPGITKLVDYWFESMVTTGKILGIVPFLGITWTLLHGKKSNLRCGAGNDFFAITTDGEITVCPIPPSFDFAKVGDIANSSPNNIAGLISLDEPCSSCDIIDICGGRCIYTNKTKYWGNQGFALVCSATRHLINELKTILPKIQTLIDQNMLKIDEFNYPIIPNGVEIIP